MGEKIKIGGIEVELVSNAEIAESKCMFIAIPLADAPLPLEANFCPGTKGGYDCSVCGQEVILAPSGQDIAAIGENPIVCVHCAADVIKNERSQ